MRFMDQPNMRFRLRARVRWFSVGTMGSPKQKLMRFRAQPHMRVWLRVMVRWFSVGPLGSGA